MEEPIKVIQHEQPPRTRVTLVEIAEVKRDFILRNLSLTLTEAGAIFSKGDKWALERVKDGDFTAVDENVKIVDKGSRKVIQASQGIRVTAVSVEAFRKRYEIEPERWAE